MIMALLSIQVATSYNELSHEIAADKSGCIDDKDCNLNGECIENICKCDAPWTGSDCGMLDVLPAPNHVSFHGESSKSTSWGGSVLRVPSKLLGGHASEQNDTYVMYVAEMLNECGLREWTTNSAVAVATSPTPDGPYTRRKRIIQPWSHNPQAIHVRDKVKEGDDHDIFAVYTLGDGDGKPVHGPVKDCRKEKSPTNYLRLQSPVHNFYEQIKSPRFLAEHGANSEDGNTTVSFTIHYSVDSPLGPFLAHTAQIVDFPKVYGFPGNWNPAPVALPDGRVRMMVHIGNSQGKIGGIIVEASNWKGPYQVLTGDVISCIECEEDPFLWIDKRGHWHALFHKMFDPIPVSDEYYLYDNYDGHPDQNGCCPSPGWSGGHAFSEDGLVWSDITRCYNTTIFFEDGTQSEMYRRERPKLIFDYDGVTPTHLSNGVFEKERGTFTLVTPLRRAL